MGTKLFVGKLPYSFTNDQLEQLFTQFGKVISARVINDKMTGQSKGFGFVEFGTAAEAQAAMALNNTQVDGQTIVVSEARPPENRSGGFNSR